MQQLCAIEWSIAFLQAGCVGTGCTDNPSSWLHQASPRGPGRCKGWCDPVECTEQAFGSTVVRAQATAATGMHVMNVMNNGEIISGLKILPGSGITPDTIQHDDGRDSQSSVSAAAP